MSVLPAATEHETEVVAPHVDFDLHGIVGVRVLEPRTGDVATVTRQLGPLSSPLSGDPDITIRFVDRLPEPDSITYAGWRDSAAYGDAFCLLLGENGVAARTLLPVDTIGKRCEVVCERRAGRVPHLLALIKGVLPMHASAFTYRGVGVLATGWTKGGKTETLLAFAARGAHYVGDEWVYLTPDGGMHGVPEPIRLWHWHVAQLPELRAGLPLGTRARLNLLPALASSATALAGGLGGLPASVLRRAAPVVRRQAYVRVAPADLFGADAIALHGRVDQLLLVVSRSQSTVSIEPVSGASVAARMAASLHEERNPFLQVYRQFRFLFPERPSVAVEEAAATERRLLDRYLSDRPAHLVAHPYPVALDSLVGPVESVLEGSP